jgi:hypothetical protein
MKDLVVQILGVDIRFGREQVVVVVSARQEKSASL